MSDPTPKQNEETENVNSDEKCTSGENQVPAKGTRSFSPPFPREVYNWFMSALKIGESSYPTSKELRKLGFLTPRCISPRQKFKVLLPRLDLETVDGSLVFSANPTQDVLVSKRTRKIIIPVEDAEKIVRRAHFFGANKKTSGIIVGITKRNHCSYSKTLSVLAKDFAVNRREFGINKLLIKKVIDQCLCALAELSSDDGSTCTSGVSSQKRQKNPRGSKASVKSVCTSSVKSGGTSTEKTSGTSTEKSSGISKLKSNESYSPPVVHEPRFSSMVAHIPDQQCIWYGRHSIASCTNRFTKLLLVMNEIKGEMALAVRGNAEAKQRLETKLYCAQLLIKDYLKSVQQSLHVNNDEASQIPTSHLENLQQEYNEASQASLFNSDLENILTSVRNNKLTLPLTLVKQIEDFLSVQNLNKEMS